MSAAPGRMSAVKLALLARERRANRADRTHGEPIAIVGMACRYPGGASSPDRYWKLLKDGVDAICEVPADRWDWKAFYDGDPATPGKMTTKWGGFLTDPIDGLDAAFFGISPREAVHLDPQQRLFLEVAHEALDDAGLSRERLAGTRTGVFVASYHNDYAQAQYADPLEIDAYTTTGTSHSILANRLSYLLDLRGPSISIDTACSSSLVAVHVACESLRASDCDFALAGGISLMLTPEMTIALSKWGFLTEDGRCKTFDERANGFVRGEGCGVITLRRLADALADGDEVLAVIRGAAVNQDGRTNVLTAPSGLAQRDVIRAALDNAALTPSELSYIEAHGTGTAIGDPIEVEALAEVIGSRTEEDRCVIGSAKTNIGHLEAAAGIAGLMKVVLALQNEAIPPHLHFQRANPHIDFARVPFSVPTALRAWPRTNRPRVAGVSSFGFGGTNAHVILEEAPLVPSRVPSTGRSAEILAISAHTPEALRALAASYRDVLREDDARFTEICAAAALRRDGLEHRLAVVSRSPSEASAQLDAFLADEAMATGARGRRIAGPRPRVAFVFCGQGPQWWSMGRELAANERAFSEILRACDAAIRSYTGWSVLEELARDEATSRLGETEIAQPALFALQVALAALWREWDVVPDYVVGHSVGEIAAAHVAGALSLDDAARLVTARGHIMQQATGLGRMAQVDLAASDVEAFIGRDGRSLSIAAVNGPKSCVLSGDASALERVLKTIAASGVSHRMLPVNYAFHSAQMAPFQAQLVAQLSGLRSTSPTVGMVSTVTASDAADSPLDAAYWGRNLREPVRFGPAIARLVADSITTFVEIGPHPVLRVGIESVLEHAAVRGTVVASLRRGVPEAIAMRTAAAGLWANGVSLRWSSLVAGNGTGVKLPAYPWQRTRYWQKPRRIRPVATTHTGSAHPLLGPRVTSPTLRGALHTTHISADEPAFLSDHRVAGTPVFPATGYIELALAAILGSDGMAATLSDVVFLEPLVLRAGETYALQLATVRDGESDVSFEVHAARAEAGDDSESWTTHARGRAVRGLPADADVSIDVRAQCTQPVDVDSFYEQLQHRGLPFGPTFRALRSLSTGRDAAVAEVALGAEADEGWRVHPALLDACLQVALAAVDTGSVGNALLLPVGLDALHVRGRLHGRLTSAASATPAADGSTWRVDITVRDANDELVADIRGLRLAPISAERIASLSQPPVALHVLDWEEVPAPTQRPDIAGRWLILADRAGLGDAAARGLAARGATPVVVTATDYLADPRSGNDGIESARITAVVRDAVSSGLVGVVHCWCLDANGRSVTDGATRVIDSLLHVVQALATTDDPPPLWIVTRGAAAPQTGAGTVHPWQAAALGFMRTVDLEHPELRVLRLDLDPSEDAAGADALVQELVIGATAEREICWRAAKRYAPRVKRAAQSVARSEPVRLERGASGLLNELALQSLIRRTPQHDEVEIAVVSAGLNFRDVLNALGMYPGEAGPLGSECAGVVTRVGGGVGGLRQGDRIMAFAPGSLGTHVTVPARWTVPIPHGLSDDEAATLPVAFLTAQFALVELARVHSGERVLIHAGTGGVGMAAIQVARDLGAEVFATAGSLEKRALLTRMGVKHVMDSRSTTFAAEVREVTQGGGVDVVLNSLAGEFIPASLDILSACGRFLEMGKRDIWSASRVHEVRPDVVYMPFDLGDAARADDMLIARLFERLRAGIDRGSMRPLPVVAYTASHAAAAFRRMAQALHVGKLAIRFVSPDAVAVRADRSYLITGGTGALGTATAEWLIARGARHLVLSSRGASADDADRPIAMLRADGVQVTFLAADVTRDADIARLFDRIDATQPPLAGIVHAAGIVDDGAVLQQTAARAAGVLDSKAGGAARLLEQARGRPLDFVVCYSSVASLLGSRGQSTYAAANAVMDALCAAARADGVPATSVQFGPWAAGGMVAELAARDANRIAQRGLASMSPAHALAAVQEAIATGLPCVAVASIAWEKHAASLPARVSRNLYASVHPKSATTTVPYTAVTQSDGIRRRLGDAAPMQRRRKLVDHVRLQALRCLGIDASTPVDDERPLKELGLDSLLAVELRNSLTTSLGIPLPATLAFDYPTPAAMAGALLERLFPTVQPTARDPRPAAPSGNGQTLATVTALSDEEAEALLLKELEIR